jgi:hypothetical protein
MPGDIEEVLPLDNAKLLDEAKPISPDGRFRLDAAKLSARHDSQVQTALKGGAFALVILGGAHDPRPVARTATRSTWRCIRGCAACRAAPPWRGSSNRVGGKAREGEALQLPAPRPRAAP